MYRLILIADIIDAKNDDEAQRRLDSFREAVLPSLNHGITLSRPSTQGDLVALIAESARIRLGLAKADMPSLETSPRNGRVGIRETMKGDDIGAFTEFLHALLNEVRPDCVMDVDSDSDDEVNVEVECADGKVRGFTVVVTNNFDPVEDI